MTMTYFTYYFSSYNGDKHAARKALGEFLTSYSIKDLFTIYETPDEIVAWIKN